MEISPLKVRKFLQNCKLLKMIPENNARILKMSFDKTAEGTVPTFRENIANNTVKFEISFIRTFFCSQNVLLSTQRALWTTLQNLFAKSFKKSLKNRKQFKF